MNYICIYADDFVCAFQYKQDAVEFYKAVGERLEKFGLEPAQEKTNITSFSRFRKEENTKFEFLSFEFRWGKSTKVGDIIKRRTAPSKLRKSLAAFTEWCKEMRNKRLRRLFPKLIAKLRGYNNYYGLIGNYNSLSKFYEQVKRILYKWLNRRIQRRSFNLAEFNACWKRYGVPKPRIVESNLVQIHFDF